MKFIRWVKWCCICRQVYTLAMKCIDNMDNFELYSNLNKKHIQNRHIFYGLVAKIYIRNPKQTEEFAEEYGSYMRALGFEEENLAPYESVTVSLLYILFMTSGWRRPYEQFVHHVTEDYRQHYTMHLSGRRPPEYAVFWERLRAYEIYQELTALDKEGNYKYPVLREAFPVGNLRDVAQLLVPHCSKEGWAAKHADMFDAMLKCSYFQKTLRIKKRLPLPAARFMLEVSRSHFNDGTGKLGASSWFLKLEMAIRARLIELGSITEMDDLFYLNRIDPTCMFADLEMQSKYHALVILGKLKGCVSQDKVVTMYDAVYADTNNITAKQSLSDEELGTLIEKASKHSYSEVYRSSMAEKARRDSLIKMHERARRLKLVFICVPGSVIYINPRRIDLGKYWVWMCTIKDRGGISPCTLSREKGHHKFYVGGPFSTDALLLSDYEMLQEIENTKAESYGIQKTPRRDIGEPYTQC